MVNLQEHLGQQRPDQWLQAGSGDVNAAVERHVTNMGPLQRAGDTIFSTSARLQIILLDIRGKVSLCQGR